MTVTELQSSTNPLLTPIMGRETVSRVKNNAWILKPLRAYFKILGMLAPVIAANQALRIFSKPRTRYRHKNYQDLITSAEKFSINHNGLAIRGMIWNREGPTVLLVHGWESGGLHLGSFVEPLLDKGFRVVMFDGPAHGVSQGKYTNLPDFANAMRRVIQKTGPIDHLIAHSFGGAASVYLAAKFPHEVPLEKMVLISVPNKLTRIIKDFTGLLDLPERVAKEMHRIIREFFHTDPAAIECGKLGKFMNVTRVLAIHDRKDEVSPFYNSLEIVHDLENAQLLETEYLGHNRILKHPEVISRVTRFLTLD